MLVSDAILFALRRDTLRIIDGDGPRIELSRPDAQTSANPKGGVVSLDLKRFADSGVALVEYPDRVSGHSTSLHI